MGAGKSTLAPLVAGKLGRPWLDLDESIARDAGQPVARIFEVEGEAAFRDRERRALLDACRRDDAPIVAVGGGALVDREARDIAHAHGRVFTLMAPIDVLAERLRHVRDRPLLRGSAREALRALLSARFEAYDDATQVFDTSVASTDVLATRIAKAIAASWSVVSRTPRSRVQVTSTPWDALADEVAGVWPCQLVVVADDTVFPISGARAHDALPTGLYVPPFVFRAGESSKSFAELARIAEHFYRHGIDRRSLVVTRGGGVTSDLGGFAAAIHKRGVRWVAVATSTVAMADAAIGGKTAIDVHDHKNGVGAFHLPVLTIIDPAFAKTELPRNVRSGLAEALKTFAVADAARFDELAPAVSRDVSPSTAAFAALVEGSAAIKAAIVSTDMRDDGARVFLNFGHTVGHALESVGRFSRWTHGEAVSLGMVAACRLGERFGRTPQSVSRRVQEALEHLQLPTTLERADLTEATSFIGGDKKRAGSTVQLVLLGEIAEPMLHPVDVSELQELMPSLATA